LANYLKMTKVQQVTALLALNWSFRRIHREIGVDRGTVAKYAVEIAANPAKVFPGSEAAESPDSAGFSGGAPPKPAKVTAGSGSNPAKVFPGSRSSAAAYRTQIQEGIDAGLTAQRIYQDLVQDYGFGHSYESVKRFVRKLAPKREAVGVMHSAAGEEAQVDFFRGPPTLDPVRGEWRRPWVFRMTLCCSRHGYEEAVWDQKLPSFLGLHENAFRAFGGVPQVIRHDNLKAAVVRACLYDPDVNPVYSAFADHWGFVGLPTRPRNPKENGKQERAGGYVKSNALKGRRFNSLAELNEFLQHWNRTVASLRIHGTTRRQVITHFEEVEKQALQPLATASFAIFERGIRTVHPDGHVEVAASFYPVPPHLVGEDLEARWDQRLVRIYLGDDLVAVHSRVRPGCFAPNPGQTEAPSSSQQAFAARLLSRCERIGDDLAHWAEAALEERGVRALRLIQGALSLVRKHPKEVVLYAARTALKHRLFRYRDLARLAEMGAASVVSPKPLLAVGEHIRPLDHYSLEAL
jgi:transposase